MPLSASLAVAWELNEASGNAADSVGSSTGAANGATAPGSGTGLVYGTTRTFNGVDQFFRVPNSPTVQVGGGDFSVEIWFNTVIDSNQQLIAKDTNTGREFTLDVYNHGSGVMDLRFYLNGGGSSPQVNAVGALAPNTWYQVVALCDLTANELRLYVNGTLAGVSTAGGGVGSTGTDLTIGARLYPAFEEYFCGRIGPARLWKLALPGVDITDLFNGGAGRTYAYITAGTGLSIPVVQQRRKVQGVF